MLRQPDLPMTARPSFNVGAIRKWALYRSRRRVRDGRRSRRRCADSIGVEICAVVIERVVDSREARAGKHYIGLCWAGGAIVRVADAYIANVWHTCVTDEPSESFG